MEDNFEIEQLISQYLSGDMNDQEKEVFERKLSEDADLQAQLDDFALLRGVFMLENLQSFDATSKDFLQSQRRKEQNKKWGLLGLGLIALISVIIALYPSEEESEVIVGDYLFVSKLEGDDMGSLKKTVIEHDSTDFIERIVASEGDTFNVSSLDQPAIKIDNNDQAVDTSVNSVNTRPKEFTPDRTLHVGSETDSIVSEPTIEVQNDDNQCVPGKLSFNYETIATCSGKSEGTITITKITGGESPYSYTINGEENDSKVFAELAAGDYTILLTDAHTCTSEQKIVINTKQCITERDGAIDISQGGTFDFKVNPGASGTLMIFDESGLAVYNETFTNREELKWDGKMSNSTNTSETQILYYLVKLSNGDVVRGEITVFNH